MAATEAASEESTRNFRRFTIFEALAVGRSRSTAKRSRRLRLGISMIFGGDQSKHAKGQDRRRPARIAFSIVSGGPMIVVIVSTWVPSSYRYAARGRITRSHVSSTVSPTAARKILNRLLDSTSRVTSAT